jgi:hypothetical protein
MPQDANDKKNISGGLIAQPPESFAVRSGTACTGFNFEDAPPPGACYVGVDDQLELGYIFDINNNSVVCNVRILTPDGLIIPLKFAPPVPLVRTVQSNRFQLVEGYILSCSLMSAFPSNSGNIPYAWAAIVRPPNSLLDQYEVLAAGYLSAVWPIGYPGSVPQKPTDGPGQPRSVLVGNPAAGADFLFTVPASTRMRITSLDAVFTTSAAVANRNPSLIIDDGANVLAEINVGINQAASLTQEYTWGDSLPLTALFNNNVMAPLPSQIVLPANFRVRSETTLIDVADQWSSIALLVHEWLDFG